MIGWLIYFLLIHSFVKTIKLRISQKYLGIFSCSGASNFVGKQARLLMSGKHSLLTDEKVNLLVHDCFY